MRDLVDHRYRIEQKLAVGGFGTVYRAFDTVVGRPVALKILHRELAGDATVVARFRREVAALAKLKSPNTLTMYDVGETDDTLYFVMELLRGESLHDVYAHTGPLPWHRMAHIARGVCNSLREAHALGIIHRDLKPANIFLEQHALDVDCVKVLDFGIAKIVASSELPERDLTRHGQVVGTFDYMAPEQMVGGVCSGRSDVFTLGTVIYEMIAGRHPYGEPASPAQMLMALMTTTPTPLTGVPVELSRIVMKCLAREPQERPEVDELDRALASVLAVTDMFGDADEPTLIDAKPPRPLARSTRAPSRTHAPRVTLPRGSVASLHVAAECELDVPSVVVARDAHEVAASAPHGTVARSRTPQGTPMVAVQHPHHVASPSRDPQGTPAPAIAAPGRDPRGTPAPAIAASTRAAQGTPAVPVRAMPAAPFAATLLAPDMATAMAREQVTLDRTLDLRPAQLARGSNEVIGRGSHPEIPRRDANADRGARASEARILEDIELALASTVTALPLDPIVAGEPAPRRSLAPVVRNSEVSVRFARPKTRLAAGTAPITDEPSQPMAIALRAVTLPPAPQSSAAAFARYAIIATCLFGLGFVGALVLWTL